MGFSATRWQAQSTLVRRSGARSSRRVWGSRPSKTGQGHAGSYRMPLMLRRSSAEAAVGAAAHPTKRTGRRTVSRHPSELALFEQTHGFAAESELLGRVQLLHQASFGKCRAGAALFVASS